MSRSLSNILIIPGNVAREIEVKYTESGLCVTNFVVAENVYVGPGKGDIDKKTGEAKDIIAVFYRCFCYNELAEQIGNSGIEVGRQVTITGRLMPDYYIDKSGTKHYGFKVLVKSLEKGARPKSDRAKATYRPEVSVKLAA